MRSRYQNGKAVIDGWDDVFTAVSREPRRQLVVSLLDASSGESVPLPEAAVNPNVPPEPGCFEMALRHHHLPMLADRGYIEWSDDPLVATRGPEFDEVAVVFRALHAAAADIPDSLVVGCQRLEEERHLNP
jgi:hypothetical protein